VKISDFDRGAAAICAAAAVLAGCGRNAVVPSTALAFTQRGAAASRAVTVRQRTPCGWLSDKAKGGHRLIYVGNGDEILIYSERSRNPSPIGCISTPVNSSHGLYVDRGGNVYVANGNNTVTVYAPGSLTPSATYFVGKAGPMYPIADGHGNVFVSTNQGTVVEFLHDRASPYRTLQTQGYEADGMAFDRNGNLYVTYRTAYLSGGIETFAPGSTQGTVLGMEVIQPQGIVVTTDGTIIVVETGRADGVYVFAKGTQNPEQTLRLGIHDTPVQLALTKSEDEIFLSAFGWLGSGRVYAAPYPLGASSHFQSKIAFHCCFKHNGHRRRHVWQIQGVALSNGLTF